MTKERFMKIIPLYPSECEHENLWYEPGPVIQCVQCGIFYLDPPNDVTTIRNIQHYPQESCPHTEKWVDGRGPKTTCLSCGRIS